MSENQLTAEEFYKALNGTNKEYSAISWNGFNLFGDKKSINEVQHLINLAGQVDHFRERLVQAEKNDRAIIPMAGSTTRELI